MLRIDNIKIPVEKGIDTEEIKSAAAAKLKINKNKIKEIKLVKKSIDARNKKNICYVIAADVSVADSESAEREKSFLRLKNVHRAEKRKYIIKRVKSNKRPVIVGFGPAGMMAGIVLARAGLRPIIIERGRRVEKRQADVDKFHKTGILDINSNVQFGEGGAGTFSDGKLTTGINDGRCTFVLEEFVKHGAPEEILYSAKPHIGTDNLITMVKRIREEIIFLGGDIRFESTLIDFNVNDGKIRSVTIKNNDGIYEEEAEYVILAIGHSARDTFEMLAEKPVIMEQKPFAVGVRIEHSQEMINKSRYGEARKYLGAADYKLWTHLENGRGVYTFCMCPGGVVSAAASEEGHIVTNGMSYYSRAGRNSNAALLVGVDGRDFGTDDVLGGMKFQKRLEKAAFIAGGGNYYAPVQTVGDLLKDKESTGIGEIEPTYKPGVTPSDMRKIFPMELYEALKIGIVEFDKRLEGFADKNAVLTAVESRSSSPLRILRNDRLSAAVKGLFPCGEGCGYAGGIMSAAVDGMKCAEAIIEEIISHFF